jgi:hypothetical protein
MAPGSVRAALMGCAVVIVATGGMILDKDQYDKVSRINRIRSGGLHLSPFHLLSDYPENNKKIRAIVQIKTVRLCTFNK